MHTINNYAQFVISVGMLKLDGVSSHPIECVDLKCRMRQVLSLAAFNQFVIRLINNVQAQVLADKCIIIMEKIFKTSFIYCSSKERHK